MSRPAGETFLPLGTLSLPMMSSIGRYVPGLLLFLRHLSLFLLLRTTLGCSQESTRGIFILWITRSLAADVNLR